MRIDLKKEIREWSEAIIVAIVLSLIIKTFVVQAFKIPSSSMHPTLMKGDKLFVNKFIYRFGDPQRWDIIVFKYPEDLKKDFIKRVVGLPGESIEIRDNQIYVNGVPQKPPAAIQEVIYYNQEPYGAPGQVTSIPEKSYFVLGDNSLSSRDSRYWGFVPEKNILGKAFFRWWPPARVGSLYGSTPPSGNIPAPEREPVVRGE